MRDIILSLGTAMMFAFCYQLMKKLDFILDMNQKALAPAGHHIIRIAFENPSMIASVSHILEAFSKKNSACELFLFSGSEKDILMKLKQQKIDFAILSTASHRNPSREYSSVKIPLRQEIVTAETVELPVLPISTEKKELEVIWKTKQHPEFIYAIMVAKRRQPHGGI